MRTYRHISLEEALAERPEDELFGPSYDARQQQLAARALKRAAAKAEAPECYCEMCQRYYKLMLDKPPIRV